MLASQKLATTKTEIILERKGDQNYYGYLCPRCIKILSKSDTATFGRNLKLQPHGTD